MTEDDFYSVNRLVEFGMTVAIAQQMVRTMNEISAGIIPAAPPPVSQIFYFALISGRKAGPFTETDLKTLITGGSISRATFLWKPGMLSWATAENIPEVLKLVVLKETSSAGAK